MRVDFLLHPISLLFDRDHCCSNVPRTADDALVVEATRCRRDRRRRCRGSARPRQPRIRHFGRTSLPAPRAFRWKRRTHTVAVTACRSVRGSHSTEVTFLVGVAMIRIIDEVNGDDHRPVRVEDRHGQAHEQEVVANSSQPRLSVCNHVMTVSSHGAPSMSEHDSQIEVWLTAAKMTTAQILPGSRLGASSRFPGAATAQ